MAGLFLRSLDEYALFDLRDGVLFQAGDLRLASRSSQPSSVQPRSLSWSITQTLSPASEYMGSKRLTGSEMASRAKTTSCRFMPSAAAISSVVGSRPVSLVSFSRACRTL